MRNKVGEVRDGLRDLFSLPAGYEVLLGNGGATSFFETPPISFDRRSIPAPQFWRVLLQVRDVRRRAPHLKDPQVIKSDVGSHPSPSLTTVDAYALTHNETSTGVMMSIERPTGSNGLVIVDATIVAGGLMVDASQFDCYYFAPQKSFSSDGGLWLAICSPAAIERIESLAASGRWTPASLIQDCARQLATQSDLQHAGPCDDPHAGLADQVVQ